MDQENNMEEGQLNIEISEEVAEGIYSNFAIITHSHAEFVVDFIKIVPGAPKAKVKSRIILTPQHAKRFMQALADNVEKFEANFGEVNDPGVGHGGGGIPMTFGGPTTQA